MNSSINESIHSLGQDSFKWWFGVVEQVANENINKEQFQNGMVRVRIIGYHTSELPDDKLPWASVLQPTTSSGLNNRGQSSNGLKNGSFVVGFFIDGDDSQQPIVIGSLYASISSENISSNSNSTDTIIVGQRNIISSTSQNTSTTSTFNTNSKSKSSDNNITNNTTSAQSSKLLEARGQPFSTANPWGQLTITPTNGCDNSSSLFKDIIDLVTRFFNLFTHVTTYDYESKLTQDINDNQQFIEIDSENFPPKGTVKINNEYMMYNEKNNKTLTQIVRVVRGLKSSHKKDSTVSYVRSEAGKFISTITNKIIDIKKEIDNIMEIITNLISWLVNIIKSYLLGLISDLLNKIITAIESKIPFNIKIIADAILTIMNKIGCTFGLDLVDSIIDAIRSVIENTVNNIINNITDFIDKVKSCINDIFDNIMSLTSLIGNVVKLIEGVSGIFKGIKTGDIIVDGKLDVNKINSISNIVASLLKILGVGCGDTSKNCNDNIWTNYTCYAPSKIICGDFRITNILKGLWNPIYPFNTVINYSSNIFSEYDVTPNSQRVLHSNPSGTFTEVFEDGNKLSVINGDKITIVQDNNNIYIRGDCNINVDGNYNLKVLKDFNLDVSGDMNLNVKNKSNFTFYGLHSTIYKLPAQIQSENELGLSSGGKLSIGTQSLSITSEGDFTQFAKEINIASEGSYNLISKINNTLIAEDVNTLIGNNRITIITNTDTLLTNQKITNIISGEFKTVNGPTFENIAGSSIKNILGGLSKTTTGVLSQINKSLTFTSRIGLQYEVNNTVRFTEIKTSDIKLAEELVLHNSELTILGNQKI